MALQASVHADIDLGALRHNLGVVRRHAPGSRVMAVVKSQAYGHGEQAVAQALEPGVDALAVARIEEGVALRQAGISCPLLVLEGGVLGEHLDLARRYDLQLVVHDMYQLAVLQADRSSAPLDCWLKIDTGMHRLGIAPDQAAAMLKQLQALPQVRVLAVMTHLANADDTDDFTTRTQIERMQIATTDIGLPRSIANSAGILGWPGAHSDWVRPGIMLYGASPLQGHSAADLDLRPVMTLSAPLIAIRGIEAGAAVGYGGTWAAPEAMPLGVVSIGYGDGYPRHIHKGAEVLLRGKRATVVGRVSMDMITIDLRGIGEARVGDRVVLWGDGLPAESLAANCNTIPYTLFCGVTGRVQRRYHD